MKISRILKVRTKSRLRIATAAVLLFGAVLAFFIYRFISRAGDLGLSEKLTAASLDHSAWFSDGTLYVSGEEMENIDGTKDWKNIVQIAISDSHVVGLDNRGNVYAAGSDKNSKCEINNLKGVKYIAAGLECSVAVMSEGTVEVFGVLPPEWIEGLRAEKNVKKVDLGDNHVLVLHEDGTVTAYGDNEYGQCDVSVWNHITDIAAGNTFSVAVTESGKVLFCGEDNGRKDTVLGWDKVKEITAGANHVVALRRDGTAVAVGENLQGQCNVQGWANVASVSAGFDHTVGILEDGTRLAIGYNKNGQCDVT